MEYFKAKNDKQLGVCIRMLLAEKICDIHLKPMLNERHKAEFYISVNVDDVTFQVLKERYETLIS